ncbi:MAG: hypothetical protein DWQ36_23275 [Acidobacteria bacterium]|nr:MAG: hypothetical protein DWQ30_19555 [Acidobacteriota bacterium]REK00336.1 MAG: hypothetical protein DWQ36_23275 [Acidobacteriota bacterium]
MYQVTARNFAEATENKIHSDEIARRYGFTGALVPGVAVWGHLTHPVVERFGEEWLRSGHAALRLHKPAYDGDRLEVEMSEEDASSAEQDAAPPGRLRVTCSNADGVLLAELVAPPADEHRLLPQGPLGGWSDAPLKPHARPLMEWDTVVEGEHFTPWNQLLAADENRRYCSQIDEPLPLYEEQGIVHPHWLLALANRALTREYVMPAWIHVSSEIRFRRLLRVDQRIVVESRVEKKWERKGHQFVRLLLRYLRRGELATEVSHTAIFRVAE